MLMFLDIEASSLSKCSWPIEIGLAWIKTDGSVASAGRLIRPDPSWSRDGWATDSAAVHGISLEELAQADPATEVAAWVQGKVGTAVLISDAPEFDSVWLARLMATADLPTPILRDLDAVAAIVFAGNFLEEEAPLRVFYAALDRAPHPHRAEADARGLAEAWAAGETARSGRDGHV